MNEALNATLKEILLRLKESRVEDNLCELIDITYPLLYNEAVSFLGNRQEAQSAVNTIYSKLWAKSDLYNPKRAPYPYILSVLRNFCRDELRKRGRIKRKGVVYGLPVIGYDMPTISHLVSIESIKLFLEDNLTEYYCRIAVLSHVEKKSIEEIAEIYSLSKSRVYDILRTIKAVLHTGKVPMV